MAEKYAKINKSQLFKIFTLYLSLGPFCGKSNYRFGCKLGFVFSSGVGEYFKNRQMELCLGSKKRNPLPLSSIFIFHFRESSSLKDIILQVGA